MTDGAQTSFWLLKTSQLQNQVAPTQASRKFPWQRKTVIELASFLSLCVVEQGMWWETKNHLGLLHMSYSWLSEISLRLPLVRMRHKVVLESSGV